MQEPLIRFFLLGDAEMILKSTNWGLCSRKIEQSEKKAQPPLIVRLCM